MALITHGDTDPVKQPGTSEWTPVSTKVVTRYEGTKAAINNKYNEEVYAGTHELVRIDEGTLSHELEIVDQTDLVDTRWELDVNIMRRALRSWTTFRDILDACLDECDKAVLAKTPFASIDWPETTCLAGHADALAKYYYLRKAGVEAYIYPAYVVRETKVVTRKSALQASHTNTSPAHVTTLPSDCPTAIIGTLPTNIEWLKIAPRVRTISNGQYEISQEYWGGTPDWSQELYGGTWNPVPA